MVRRPINMRIRCSSWLTIAAVMTTDPDWVFAPGEGSITCDDILPRLLREFPEFEPRWNRHLLEWNDKPAGDYNDISVFVKFVVDDLYPANQIPRLQRVFDLMEEWLAGGSQAVQELIVLGFFEDLQNIASWRPFGREAFIPFLGKNSRSEWEAIEKVWAGKSSLMDVVRAERKSKG